MWFSTCKINSLPRWMQEIVCEPPEKTTEEVAAGELAQALAGEEDPEEAFKQGVATVRARWR